MVRQTNAQSSDPLPNMTLKGAGASKLIVWFFAVLGLIAMIGAPGAGKLAGFLITATVLLTYFISGAYRVIFLRDRMRYGLFGHASVAYNEMRQLRDINSWSLRYRKLIITMQDGRKVRLWNALPYNDQIVSELKCRAVLEYIDTAPTPLQSGSRDNPKPRR